MCRSLLFVLLVVVNVPQGIEDLRNVRVVGLPVGLLTHLEGLFIEGDGLGVLAVLVVSKPQVVEELCDVGVGFLGTVFL